MACIVLMYHKQSDLYHKHTQLLQLLCQVTLHYPHQGSFSEVEQQGLIFVYFVSIFQLILGLTYAMLMVEQPGIDTSTLSSLDVWGMAGFIKFLCHDWFILYIPLSWYSQVSRLGGTATVISRLNFPVSGYFIQFPDYHDHAAATSTFFRRGMFCHTRQLELWIYLSSELPFWVCISQISYRRPCKAL